MANLRPGQHAGSRHGNHDLGSYISGYIDGEGCFTASISPRPTLLVGWEVRPSLSVSQNGDRAEVLLLIQEHFGCGTIRPDRSDRTLKWEIRSLTPIRSSVIPHFRMYPMFSGKQRDFERFADICELMARGAHCHRSGLREIVRLTAGMNPSGRRTYTSAEIIDSLSR